MYSENDTDTSKDGNNAEFEKYDLDPEFFNYEDDKIKRHCGFFLINS